MPYAISFTVTRGVDAFLEYRLTMQPPATIRQERLAYPDTFECSYPAPACDDPSRPDFAEVRALLAHPEIVALREQEWVDFGDRFTSAAESKTLEFGTRGVDGTTISVINEPPLCSALEQDDAGSNDCLPDVLDQLFDLLASFSTLHTCVQ